MTGWILGGWFQGPVSARRRDGPGRALRPQPARPVGGRCDGGRDQLHARSRCVATMMVMVMVVTFVFLKQYARCPSQGSQAGSVSPPSGWTLILPRKKKSGTPNAKPALTPASNQRQPNANQHQPMPVQRRILDCSIECCNFFSAAVASPLLPRSPPPPPTSLDWSPRTPPAECRSTPLQLSSLGECATNINHRQPPPNQAQRLVLSTPFGVP